MTTPTTDSRPQSLPTRAPAVQRYGPLAAIVAAIVLVATLVTVTGRDGANQVSAGGRNTGAGAGNGSEGGGGPAMPITYEQAKASGKDSSTTWVENCDPSTGRVKMPTVSAFPCVPKFSGANGGDVFPGVTADKISVVYYTPPQSGDILAQLAGSVDTIDDTKATVSAFVEMLNGLAETYGRKVDLQFYEGKQAAATDATAARAEATEVIERFKPFASIGGPGLTPAYAEEMAANNVICVACGTSLADQAFQDNAPHLWGVQASPEQWLTNVTDFIGKRLANRPAKWAGDPGLRSSPRKFGVVNFEQDPPQFSAIATVGDKCKEVNKWSPAVRETYLLTNMQDRAPTIIAKLKAEKITTVVFMGDPFMPAVLTPEATKQNYFPEWIVTGTVLTDTTTLARRYDARQWEHAFGLSQLAVTVPREQTDPWTLHQWYFGTTPKAAKTQAVLWSSIFLFFNGVHMAGPNLTDETFKQGMFNLPVSGGGPTTPRVSYGDHGAFKIVDQETCAQDKPRIDYLGTDDMVEIWWDGTYNGPDEQGNDGKGKYRYANGGKRYLPREQPTTDADAFKVEGSVLEFKERPARDKAPTYPSPRK
jgi:hypothetical protein